MEDDTELTRRQFVRAVAALALTNVFTETADGASVVQDYPVGELQSVPVIRQRPEWKQFIILVWQFQNDVLRDVALYDQAGLHGFHIDRGAGEDEKVRLSLERRFPYYVDHAAGKGILYLSSDLQKNLSGKASLSVRPHSLADPKTIEALKSLLRENIATTKKGFDDEISLGALNNPVEVDTHPLSVAWYRRWLERRYGTIGSLNSRWGTAHPSFDAIQPIGFEQARRLNSTPPFSSWNLSSWMEWRHFMDYQFAQVLADLTRYTNNLDPTIPAGFVGGQQPSAYGGYDSALISRAVQWMEALEMGGISEILRSFWNRLAHGQQAAIAWPNGWMRESASGKRELSAAIEALTPTFREIQGRASEFIVNPDSYL